MRYSVFSVLITLASVAIGDQPAKPRFRALDNAATWKRLPRAKPDLPVWARILTRSLPKTTAAMLRLDYVQRVENPLDPKLRGKLRWVAALANRCEYGWKYAESDLREIGMTPAEWKNLYGDWKTITAKERIALQFARKMTAAAHTVTDAEFSALLKAYGPKTVVAMVHTLAYANFQDRIFLALEINIERDGPLEPLDLDFDFDRLFKMAVPKRPAWKTIRGIKVAAPRGKLEWEKRSFDQMQKLLESQKSRTGRIPLPVVKKGKKPSSKRINWSAVSLGYQPNLTKAWFDCMGTFQREAKLDRVFANSMFWVITRSNECYY